MNNSDILISIKMQPVDNLEGSYKGLANILLKQVQYFQVIM